MHKHMLYIYIHIILVCIRLIMLQCILYVMDGIRQAPSSLGCAWGASGSTAWTTTARWGVFLIGYPANIMGYYRVS